MIKKSLFEDELIHGMQRELQSHEKKQGMANLVQAAEYLHSAAEIFEEAGLTTKADQVLQILEKIAIKHDTRAKELPAINLHKLMEHGVLPSDLHDIQRDPMARARVNTAYRKMGYLDKEIKSILGDSYMSEQDAADMLNPKWVGHRFMEWMRDPTAPIDPENPTPSETFQQNVTQWMKDPTSQQGLPSEPEQFEMKSLLQPQGPSAPGTGEELEFQSIAQELGLVDDNDAKGKPRKPKNPTKVHDPHIPTIKQEVQNYKTHGWAFNMADDGNAADTNNVDVPQPKSFDEFYEKWKARHMKEEPAEEAPITVREPSMRPKPMEDAIPMQGVFRPELSDDLVFEAGEADDMLDADIDEKPLAVHEDSLGKTFEDSD